MVKLLYYGGKKQRLVRRRREDGMKALCVLAVALIAAMTAGPADAADAIKIGVIYPLTGNAASAGASAKDAVGLGAEITSKRYAPEPGDIPALLEALADDYETTGDAVIRTLALEDKVPSLQPLLELGRASHREWVETMFGAPELTPELVVATDVYSWKLLRRDQGLSRDETVASIQKIVEALLERRTR